VTIATKPRQALRLRGRSFLALVLAPEPPLDGWFRELDNLINGSAGFFVGRPVILDATRASPDEQTLRHVLAELAARNVRVMGVEGAKPHFLGPDLPPGIAGGRQSSEIEVPDEPVPAVSARHAPVAPVAPPPPPEVPAPAAAPEGGTMLIDTPIRSGQSIIFQGDVTVVGSVASGAEIVATGSIHVYGALRGRAIAGWNGNAEARIFCRRMEAELIAINGLYQTAEDMAAQMRGRAVQAWLDGDAIRLTELT